MPETALILGASGRFGRHCATAFAAAGWSVRTYKRGTDMIAASRGSDLIVNGLNPPNYQNWETAIPKIAAEAIAAAKASGATLLVPGNVYNFGAQPGPWSATTPQAAQTRKGRIRIEMENTYRAAAAEGVRTIILRAGDFIDTEASGGFFDLVIAKPVGKGKISYPGRRDIAHAWAYLPDLGRAAVALADIRDRLPAYADIPYEGWTLSGTQLAEGISTAIGKPVRAGKMSWLPIKIASPFWSLGRELLEMRYLWNTPHELDGTAFRRLVPGFTPTPMAEALSRVLPDNVHPNEAMVAADGLA